MRVWWIVCFAHALVNALWLGNRLTPFKLLSVLRTGQNLTLTWESQSHRTFDVEASSNLVSWVPFATNLQSASGDASFIFMASNVEESIKFFRIHRVP